MEGQIREYKKEFTEKDLVELLKLIKEIERLGVIVTIDLFDFDESK